MPAPTINQYFGVQVNMTKTGNKNVAGEDLYDVTVNNIGDKCIIRQSYITGCSEEETSPSISVGWSYYTSYIFNNWIIAPGQSINFVTPIYGEEKEDYSGYTWSSSTYEIACPEVSFIDLAIVKTGVHTYKLDGKINNLDDHYYSAVLEVTYKDKDYAFEVAISQGDSRVIPTKEDLDLDKLTIKKVTVYRSAYNTYKQNYRIYYMPYIFLGVFILLISSFIVVPIIIVISVNKRNKVKKISK